MQFDSFSICSHIKQKVHHCVASQIWLLRGCSHYNNKVVKTILKGPKMGLKIEFKVKHITSNHPLYILHISDVGRLGRHAVQGCQ